MGYLYRWIGFVILGAGIILSAFLPLIFPNNETGFQLKLIYFTYYAFLGSSLIGYFINYRQNLLGADQKNYVITACFQSTNILKTIIQITLAYYTSNLYLWVTIEFSFGVVYSLVLNWKINQIYPWLKANTSLGRKVFKKYPDVMIKTRQLFIHRITYFVQFQTIPLLIYSFVSLPMVSFYGNYTIVLDKLQQLLNQILGSSQAAIGNLCAEQNTNKALKIYRELFSMRFLISSVLAITLFFTLSPLISLWLGNEYILTKSTVTIIIFISCFVILRGATDHFINAYGLFQDTWAPLLEAILYIVFALIGGYLWSLPGILMGSVISQISIIGIWKPYFLFSQGFRVSVWKYWKHFFVNTISVFLSFCVLKFIINQINMQLDSWGNFIYSSIIIFTLTSLLIFIILYIVDSGMRDLVHRCIKH